MKPSRLALAWCLYSILFFVIGRLVHTYTSHDWVYSKLSKHLDFIGYYVWDDLYMDILLLLSILLNCMAMALTAKPACKFINQNISKDIQTYKVTPLKLVLILHAFAALYVIVLSLTLTYMPEIETYEKISKRVDNFILETFKEYTHDYLSLPFSLITMSAIVVLVSSFAIRLPNLLRRWDRSPISN